MVPCAYLWHTFRVHRWPIENVICQTPAGQRPQSVVFKLRSRLGDSARPEQSTTRRICLRLPVAQPTAVGDARQEPPLRISRAAGYGERYGRAAGTQHTRKELSSYAFCPISFVESFHGFLRQCPSRSLMKITPSAEYICYLI